MRRIRPAPGGWGTEAGVRSPHQGNCFRTNEKHLRLLERKQLICDSLNRMRITQTMDRDTSPLESAAAGNNPRVRSSVNYEEMAQENVRGGDLGEKCLWRENQAAKEARLCC